MFCVYIHTFPNNKKYIGTTSMDVISRWGKNGSGYKGQILMENAIKKYGWDSVRHEVVAYNLTKKEASLLEICLIKIFKTTDRNFGYNVSPGGLDSPPVTTKEVICFNSLKKYNSVSEASIDVGIAPSGISRACNGKQKYAGYDKKTGDPLRWGFYNPVTTYVMDKTVDKICKKKPILCVETNKVYSCAKEAGIDMNIKSKTIARACQRNNSCYGYHFKYVT